MPLGIYISPHVTQDKIHEGKFRTVYGKLEEITQYGIYKGPRLSKNSWKGFLKLSEQNKLKEDLIKLSDGSYRQIKELESVYKDIFS